MSLPKNRGRPGCSNHLACSFRCSFSRGYSGNSGSPVDNRPLSRSATRIWGCGSWFAQSTSIGSRVGGWWAVIFGEEWAASRLHAEKTAEILPPDWGLYACREESGAVVCLNKGVEFPSFAPLLRRAWPLSASCPPNDEVEFWEGVWAPS